VPASRSPRAASDASGESAARASPAHASLSGPWTSSSADLYIALERSDQRLTGSPPPARAPAGAAAHQA
jgi:hypothetical protein